MPPTSPTKRPKSNSSPPSVSPTVPCSSKTPTPPPKRSIRRRHCFQILDPSRPGTSFSSRAEHLNSRHGPLKSVLRHTFTCDRKLLASWQVVSSWKAKDAAEQKIISGEDGSRRASDAG